MAEIDFFKRDLMFWLALSTPRLGNENLSGGTSGGIYFTFNI